MISYMKCPKCSADMEDILLTSYPAINIKKCPRCGYEVRPNKEMTISHKISEMKLYDFKTNELLYDSSIDGKYEKEIAHERDSSETIITK